MSATSTSTATSTATGTHVSRSQRYLTVRLDGIDTPFHYVWLRDNCWCPECKVAQSAERRLYTADIADDIAVTHAEQDDEQRLWVEWNDGHRSSYSTQWLRRYDYSAPARESRRHDPTLWDASLSRVPRFEHAAVVGTTEGQLAYLDALRDFGVAVVANTPPIPGEVERFAETIGHVRETAFERIHNVRHDPSGYNVAHTPLELKPHTDLPSYHWPPSIQLLHFLVNEASGGQSTVTDGWAVLADLRRDDPAAFDTLTHVPVRFQLFSEEEDTAATSPMVQLDTAGQVCTFRYSNQLAQPLDVPFDDVERFYTAYRRLGRMIDSDRYTHVFRTRNGDLLTVHGHRVMHGRLPYDPASGARHLQDAYMEFDDLMARRRVLAGTHKPLPAQELAR
ncbi:MAG: TauD/TfdA family dioxygenase [Ornithinimicrobium sp.]